MIRSSALFTVLVLLALPRFGISQESALVKAQEHLDAGQAEEALAILEPFLQRHADHPQALLLRSTARIMQGEVAAGRGDLDRAIALDPRLRQAWLNRAALDIADRRYDEALKALRKAEELDPAAPDNDLNIGAVLLLQGDLKGATERFEEYLKSQAASAEAHYLVASNYALAGYAALAVETLRPGVELDERIRLRARTDPNFADLANHPRFQELLNTDVYRLPEGAYFESRIYTEPYDPEGERLLGAVIDALTALGEPFNALVEVTPRWALIWGDFRIKVVATPEGEGVVEVSAPAQRFTPREWRRRTERLFRQIQNQIRQRRPLAPDVP